MTLAARIALVLATASTLACGVAVAVADDEIAEGEVQMTGDAGGERVLGKRAFDAAAQGYAPFEPLVGEAPQRTLVRARERLAELEADLQTMQRHVDPTRTEVVTELADTAVFLSNTQGKLAAANDPDNVDAEQLDAVVALVDEAQLRLHGVRQHRVHSDAI